MSPSDPLRRLEAVIDGIGPAITAFSGGVDSTLVAVVSARVHDGRAVAVTGVSPSLAESERERALEIARSLGLRHRLIDTHELDRADYRRNAGDRCFHCKTELFERLVALGREEGFRAVLSGDNVDDLHGHRPGLRAGEALGVHKPLVAAGLDKESVRRLARELGLPNHDKPASPCLASRVPDGTPVDAATLGRIEGAEEAVRSLGFRVFRVRHHGELARLEVAVDELPAAIACRDTLLQVVQAAGYRFVALDLAPFRSGSLTIVR